MACLDKEGLVSSSLQAILAVVTITVNVNQNDFLNYFMIHDIFTSLNDLVDENNVYTEPAVFILGLLMIYKKNETTNPYIERFSRTNDKTTFDVCSTIYNNSTSFFF